MATKAEITTHINTELASGSLIPASNHRGVLHTNVDSVLENLYGIKTTDTNATTNVYTESDPNIEYNFSITKIGTRVFVDYIIENSTGAILPASTVCSITTTEYEQSGFLNITGFSTFTSEPIRLIQITNSLATVSPLGIGESVRGQFSYNTSA